MKIARIEGRMTIELNDRAAGDLLEDLEEFAGLPTYDRAMVAESLRRELAEALGTETAERRKGAGLLRGLRKRRG